MRFVCRIIIILKLIFFFHDCAPAQACEKHLQLTRNDRILVIAPHPDDEVIGSAGVIRTAKRLNIPVHIMYLTNGDSNIMAFSIYKKRPVFGKNQLQAMGAVRQKEAIESMRSLGLSEDQLTFLSYPDRGIMKIFKKYWKPGKVYRNPMTGSLTVPYLLSLTPGAPHDASSILADYKTVLTRFKPTKIFVTHPADLNLDHQAAVLFLKVAMWDLYGVHPEQSMNQHVDSQESHHQPRDSNGINIFGYLVHAIHWPVPMGFFPDQKFEQLNALGFQSSRWVELLLNQEDILYKKQAVELYRTQIPYRPRFLFSFIRANEVFDKLSQRTLQDNKDVKVVLTDQHKSNPARFQILLKSVTYAQYSDQLIVELTLNRWLRSDMEVDVFLFGYKKGVSFATLPKYRLRLSPDDRLDIFDGADRVRLKNIDLDRRGSKVVITVPLAVLGRPDQIIASVTALSDRWPKEFSGWEWMGVDYGK